MEGGFSLPGWQEGQSDRQRMNGSRRDKGVGYFSKASAGCIGRASVSHCHADEAYLARWPGGCDGSDELVVRAS